MLEKEKDAIRAMRLQGLSYRAIGDILGLGCNTVKSFCYRENLAVSGSHGIQPMADPGCCKNCGGALTRLPNAKRKLFCSDRCRYAWWNRIHRHTKAGRVYQLVCQGCGGIFTSHGNNRKKYCGPACYQRSRYGKGLP